MRNSIWDNRDPDYKPVPLPKPPALPRDARGLLDFQNAAGNQGLPAKAPSAAPDTSGFFPEIKPYPGFSGSGSSSTSIFSGGGDPVSFNSLQDPSANWGLGEDVRGELEAILGGKTRYSPEVLERMKGSLLSTTEGRRENADAATKADAVSRGQFRSGQTAAMLGANRRSADSDYSGGVNDIMMDKAKTDFEDKMSAIDRAEKHVAEARAWALSQDMNESDKLKFNANLRLAYLKIQEERNALESTMGMQWNIAQLNRQPIEGRDFIYTLDENGQRVPIWLSAYDRGSNSLYGGN